MAFISRNFQSGITEAFSDRNFRIYSVGSITSWITFFIQLIAVNWYAWEITQSTAWLAIITLMDILPTILFMPFCGALADRYDRLKIWKISNFLLLSQAVLIAYLAWIDQLPIITLAALVFIHGIFVALTVPAMNSMLPRFIAKEKLTSAIAVNASYTQFAVFVGPALAGFLIANFDIAIAFGINAFGYMVLLLVIYTLKTPEDFTSPTKSEKSIMADIQDGFSYIFKHPQFMPIVILMLLGDFLMSAVYYMTPAFSDQLLEAGVIGVSAILAARGIGATITALWLAHGGEALIIPHRIIWAFLISMIALVIMYLFPNLYIAIAMSVIMGLAGEFRRTLSYSYIQVEVIEEQRGRVMGSLFMLGQCAGGIGTYIVGAIAVNYGLIIPTLLAAAFCFAIWLILFIRRPITSKDGSIPQAHSLQDR
ncbi:MFS transporter [Curvivirga sp.]|uniref:MFS transporter n=1 Tax=Curvivirga sp. TaxID=2856848 RepID=UPI003B5990A9